MQHNIYITAVLLAILAAFLALYVHSLRWAYGDAERRGKPGWLVVLLIALASWPLSLLAWIVFRPEIALPPPEE